MVGEPLLRMGVDLMGVRLPVEMDPPRAGGSGLAGRGCVTAEAKRKTEKETSTETEEKTKGEGRESHLDTGPQTPEAYA